MAYDGVRSYINCSAIAAANAICTGSNQVITTTNAGYIPISEPTFVCSIAGVVTATPTTPPATVKYAVLSGTSTVGSVTIAQAVGSAATATITPPVAVSAGVGLTVSVISTGTASATETTGACTVIIGVAPQYV